MKSRLTFVVTEPETSSNRRCILLCEEDDKISSSHSCGEHWRRVLRSHGCAAAPSGSGPDDEDVLHIHWPEKLCPDPGRSRLRRYGACLQETEEAVIPHGMYSWYPQSPEDGPTRSTYGYDAADLVILAFGSIRRPEELELLLSGFEAADVPSKQLLVAGGVVWPSRLTLRHNPVRLRTLLSPVQLVEGFVPQEDVPGLFNLADTVVIPRTDALNSGNVALGFTFGKVVVGPDMGGIGETLRKAGNPVFDPTEPSTLGWALEQARSLAAQGKGKDNHSYAEAHLYWDTIADRHAQYFTSLTRNEAVL